MSRRRKFTDHPEQVCARSARTSNPHGPWPRAPAPSVGKVGTDEHERREREIFADFLAGTPIEGDAGELDRLMQVDCTLARMQVVSVIRAGQADSVAGALANLRWRREFYWHVRDDIDGL